MIARLLASQQQGAPRGAPFFSWGGTWRHAQQAVQVVRALEVDWQTLPAGAQPLRFSEAIANPVFAFVSLNGNGYGFDRDFDILSITGSDGAACGHWGSGCVTRRIVDLGGGVLQHHQLNSTGGESHGAIRFMGSFDTVTWNSLSNENWNGVTVGVQGTSIEVFGLPERVWP